MFDLKSLNVNFGISRLFRNKRKETDDIVGMFTFSFLGDNRLQSFPFWGKKIKNMNVHSSNDIL